MMINNKIIEELKEEHILINDLLIKLRRIGINSVSGMELLYESKDLIISHLEKEDKDLYAILKDESINNKTQIDFYNKLEKEMIDISIFVKNFYKNILKSVVDKNEFYKEINKFIVYIKNRCLKEEYEIYNVFNKNI